MESKFPNGDKITEYCLGKEMRSIINLFLKRFICFKRFNTLKEARRIRDQMNNWEKREQTIEEIN